MPMPDFKDHILGAIRKKGVFVYNRFSPSQARDYRKALEELEAQSVVARQCEAPNRWLYTQGAAWNRRA